MCVKAINVANEFINLGIEESNAVTPLKLQKLLYFSQGWHLAMNGAPLFFDEIRAWKYGPVIEEIYNTFRSFKSNPITLASGPGISEDKVETKEFVRSIWNLYKKIDGITLSNWSHEVGGPWDLAKGHYASIPQDTIHFYFKAKLEEARLVKSAS